MNAIKIRGGLVARHSEDLEVSPTMTSLVTVGGRRSPGAHLTGVSLDSCLAYCEA